MADPSDPDNPSERPPEYRVYRSRPKLLGGGSGADRRLRLPRRGRRKDGGDPRPRRTGGRRISPGRVIGYAVLAALGWALLSLAVFMVSALIQREQVDDAAGDALSASGYTLTSPNTILVLGSDARTKGSKEPGANKIGSGAPSRADTILLMRAGGGRSARLSIPRDTTVDIPGFGRNKINAAYALGGPALAVETVEQYLGIEVNHLVEVNFENFPDFIDALGGIDVRTGCVVSRINGGFKNGGYTLRLKPGENHLDGRAALALARTRKNECKPTENDLTRARRQQKILSAIRGRVVSPTTFLRGPLVGWSAPKAIRSDMAGPSLLGLFGAMATGGTPDTEVLGRVGPDGEVGVTDEVKQREVRRFLRG